MLGNRFASSIGITGFGESHGKAIGVVFEDIKPGVDFPLEDIQMELDKRRPGKKDYTSPRNETDRVQVLSGVLDGKTTGMPICLIVYNTDQRSSDYQALKDIFRPGHADYSWFQKFKIYDWRGGGRASGRETISRVAAGAMVKKMLDDIKISAYPVRIGKTVISQLEDDFANPLLWHDSTTYEQVLQELQEAQIKGDSLGGIVEVIISKIPAGLGDPVFGKLDSRLAEALISIGGIKGIEFGAGFLSAEMSGSIHNDQMDSTGFLSNNAGGILGGVSTGQNIIIKLAVKPVSSINIPQKTIDIHGQEKEITRKGRHDTCLILRIIPVITAMIRLVLADCISYQKLLSNSHEDLNALREALEKIDEDILISLRKREEISKKIGVWKKANDYEVFDPEREEKLYSLLKGKAEILELNPDIIEEIWRLIVSRSKDLQ